MKILFYYPGDLSSLRRGTPIRSYKLYSSLCELHDVHLVASAMPPDFSGDGTAIVPGIKGCNWLRRVQTLRRLLREYKPDVVYGQTHRSLPTLFLAGSWGKTCVDLHGLYHEETGRNAVSRFCKKLVMNWLIALLAGVTVPSRTLAGIYAPIAKECSVVPGGVDMAMMDRVEPERLQVSGVPVITYCGNLREYQGVTLLLSALRDIRHLPWHFLFVCSSEEQKAARMLAEYGMADRTTLLWNLPQQRVFALLKGADIAVIPRPDIPITRYSFPSKMPEYLASGAAVISTDVSDAFDLVHPGETGWLVPPGNVQALGGAIVSALSDSAARIRMSAAARELMRKRYDWHVIVADLSSFLYSLTA